MFVLTRCNVQFGTNWRALITILLIVPPLLPGLAHSISPTTVHLSAGILHLYSFNWLFGFCTSVVLYWALSVVSPAHSTLVKEPIPAFRVIDGREVAHIADEMDDEHIPTTAEVNNDPEKGAGRAKL